MCAFLDGGRVFAVLALFRSFRRLKQNSRLQAVVATDALVLGIVFEIHQVDGFFSFPAWPS